jgi:hypothetical protein
MVPMLFATTPALANVNSTAAIFAVVALLPKRSVSDSGEVCCPARFIVAGFVTSVFAVPSSRLAVAVITAPPDAVFERLKLSFVSVEITGNANVVIIS